MKKPVSILIIVVCLCLIGLSGYQLYQYWEESAQSRDTYSALENYVKIPAPSAPAVNPSEQADTEEDPAPSLPWPQVDFDALGQINGDVVAWLFCEGTPINYPVVQGEDNVYYLNHLFDGAYNVGGCLFLDCGVSGDFSGRNSIIYGHQMRNGTMFSSLSGYKKQDFYEGHPQLLLVTPENRFVVELFAGYVANVEDAAWEISFADEAAFEQWLAETKGKSMFESGVEPTSNDRILTLSTCSYEFDNARFVVMGVLVPSGEK